MMSFKVIFAKLLAALLLASIVPLQASAGVIEVFGDVNSMASNSAARNKLLLNLLGSGDKVLESKQNAVFPNPSGISTYYNTLAGVTATLSGANIDSALLAGVDVLFLNIGCCGTASPYSASEVTAMATFLGQGGTIGLLDEICCSANENVTRVEINQLLTALGSTIQYAGWDSSSGIATMASPMGAGVIGYNPTTFAYMTGGTAVATLNGHAMVVYEQVGGNAVPEPASLALLGLGLAALGFSRRRKFN